eukprot:TRINITY_DN3003_c0_g1_i1.p1 TRINITY_DN3003_c0_g1~~TRINITY_DN3003_c0_g1_i1.p1  ORF type:complete len:232 (-),score=75.23 TRINITY_DN3003_c0_g1_i1:43-738(-)
MDPKYKVHINPNKKNVFVKLQQILNGKLSYLKTEHKIPIDENILIDLDLNNNNNNNLPPILIDKIFDTNIPLEIIFYENRKDNNITDNNNNNSNNNNKDNMFSPIQFNPSENESNIFLNNFNLPQQNHKLTENVPSNSIPPIISPNIYLNFPIPLLSNPLLSNPSSNSLEEIRLGINKESNYWDEDSKNQKHPPNQDPNQDLNQDPKTNSQGNSITNPVLSFGSISFENNN